ncbi:MAG: NusG domain II-containing protein [Clostridia bacterium]|nr:NusG domain II-containing protein [Clostridia bacterium]
MKTNVYESVKNKKPFGIFDLIIYAAVILVCLSLFLGFVILPAKADSDGFKVLVNEKEVFVFHYSDNSYEINAFDCTVDVDDSLAPKVYTVKITLSNDEFNVITVHPDEKTVEVTDADCSAHKDCVHTPAIKGGSGAIYCLPHGLKVLPLKVGYVPIETGGV